MSQFDFDLVVIGSGPGGYVAAIRASQLGLRTAVVEKDKTLGGTCLNVGCIPSKALLESSEYLHFTQHDAAKHGIEVGDVKFDLQKMLARKSKIVTDLTGGIAFLFKKNKIQWIQGHGRILGKNKVEVTTSAAGAGGATASSGSTSADGSAATSSASSERSGEKKTISAKNILCATGSVPTDLPFLKFNEKNVVSSTGALSLEKVPKHLIVIGGGVIGLELGSVWLRLGASVTVLEFMDRLCPTMDQQSITLLKRSLEKQGMKFILNAKASSCREAGSELEITYEDRSSGEAKKISGDVVLVSTGRKPFSEGLGLDELGVKKDQRGFVIVDEHFQTNVKGIYAIGDLVPGPMLAHKAEEEGVAVAEILAGESGHVNYHTVPSVIYTYPEVASVGYTEEQLKEKGIAYNAGSFPFLANGRAKALGLTDGMVKILAAKESDKILGGHIVGPRASELLGEIVIAMEFGGSSEDLARSFHAHPTLNEVVREAALGVTGRIRQM